uniref:Wall-associated receptor kinase galacturonan-binding domain-containing protein n=1 Tax=Araucaria cunninghamii TaxID=56994 RepID=A0A0D6R3I2_ARACU
MEKGSQFSDRMSQIFVVCTFVSVLLIEAAAQSSLCRTSCAGLSIQYPFGIDDGCGSVDYRSLLVCTNDTLLELRTPTGRYPVKNISYDEPHIIISDPSMWSCKAGAKLPQSQSFSLDVSRKFSLSNLNTFLYFKCNESSVLVQPQLRYCESQPRRCETLCDTNNYLCNNLPGCPKALSGASCCSYYPRTSDSLRLMIENCESYTSVYWEISNVSGAYTQLPAYGIRLNYEIPIITHCLNCQDDGRGGGTCGYDTQFGNFTCLCRNKNVTTYCPEHGRLQHLSRARVVAGTVVGVAVGGMIAAGVIIWYLRKIRPNRPLRLGVANSRNGMS